MTHGHEAGRAPLPLVIVDLRGELMESVKVLQDVKAALALSENRGAIELRARLARRIRNIERLLEQTKEDVPSWSRNTIPQQR